jgi:hypothetical protein
MSLLSSIDVKKIRRGHLGLSEGCTGFMDDELWLASIVSLYLGNITM